MLRRGGEGLPEPSAALIRPTTAPPRPLLRSALVFEPKVQAYVPCGKEWIKKKAFTHLRRLADQAR